MIQSHLSLAVREEKIQQQPRVYQLPPLLPDWEDPLRGVPE